MTKVSEKEIVKLAQLSCINVEPASTQQLLNKLNSVLSYASEVISVAAEQQAPALPYRVNIVREDLIIATNPQTIIACAPVHEEQYFVVPAIIKQ